MVEKSEALNCEETNIVPQFHDRTDAGRKLVPLIEAAVLDMSRAINCAIPNGGVPVAFPIAEAFGKFLHVIVARKIQYPWTTEAGFGAITSDGITSCNRAAIEREHISETTIDIQSELARAEVQKRARLFKNFLLPNKITASEVVLIDDGLASGITIRAAILSLQKRGAQNVIVAVPTAHRSSITQIEAMSMDDMMFTVKVVAADIRGGWSFAVADAYEVWQDVASTEIILELSGYNRKFFPKSPS